MSGPARHGALIYSGNVERLAGFYRQLFAMQELRNTHDFVSLDKEGFNLIIHVPPCDLPDYKFSPVKLFFTVEDMATARECVVRLGGEAFEGQWANPVFTVSNIADCDGNHIHIRVFDA